MKARPPQPPPIAEALAWVSRITSVGLLMVLPILGGRWMDERWQTRFGSQVGLVLGLTLGLLQLWGIAREGRSKRPPPGGGRQTNRSASESGSGRGARDRGDGGVGES